MKQDSYVTSSPASPPTVCASSGNAPSQSRGDMLALLEKIQEAPAANYMLDGEVAIALYPSRIGLEREHLPDGSIVDYENGRKVGRWRPMNYTASIDAALNLFFMNLSGWHVQMNTGDGDQRFNFKPWAKVAPNLNNDAGWKAGAHDARAATQPLAILAATIKAILATEAAE